MHKQSPQLRAALALVDAAREAQRVAGEIAKEPPAPKLLETLWPTSDNLDEPCFVRIRYASIETMSECDVIEWIPLPGREHVELDTRQLHPAGVTSEQRVREQIAAYLARQLKLRSRVYTYN